MDYTLVVRLDSASAQSDSEALRAALGRLGQQAQQTNAGLAAAARQASDAIGAEGKAVEDLGASATTMGARVAAGAAVAAGAIATIGVVLSEVATSGLEEFKGFERGLISVGKTAGIQGDELVALGKDVDALSRRLPVATATLLDVASAAGSLGIKGSANITLFTETVAKLGTASDLAGDTAANALAQILNTTGESTDQVRVLASVIVALGNDSNATESQIASLATNIAAATAAFHVSSTDAAAMAAALASIGVQAELGGSVIGRAFQTIDQQTRQGAEHFKDLEKIVGMSGAAFRRVFQEDSPKALQIFLDGLKRINERGGDVAGALEKIGLDALTVGRILPVLANHSSLLGDALRIARQEASAGGQALDREFGAGAKSLSSQLQLAENELASFRRELGAELAPAVLDVVKGFRNWLSANHAVSQSLGHELADGLRSAASLLGSLVAHVDELKTVVQALIAYRAVEWVRGLGLAAAGTAPAVAGLARSLGPIGLIAAAVTLAFGGMTAAVNSEAAAYDRADAALQPYSDLLREHLALIKDLAAGATTNAEATVNKARADADLSRIEGELLTAAKERLDADRQVREAEQSMGEKGTANYAALSSASTRYNDLLRKREQAVRAVAAAETQLAAHPSGPAATKPPGDGGAGDALSEEAKRQAKAFEALRQQLDGAYAAQSRFDSGWAVLTAEFQAGRLPLADYVALTRELADQLYPDTPATPTLADELARLRAEALRGAIPAIGGEQRPGFGSLILEELNQRERLGKLKKRQAEDDERTAEQTRQFINDQVEGWTSVGQTFASVVGTFSEGAGRMVAALAQIASAYAAVADAQKRGDTAGQVMGGASMGSDVGGLGQQLGAWSGPGGQSQFGGQMSGDFGTLGATVGGAIGSYFGPIGAVVGSVLGGVIGGAIKSGADEGLGELRSIAGEVALSITRDEGGLGAAVGDIGRAFSDALSSIETLTGGDLLSFGGIDLKIRENVVSVFSNGLVRRFTEVDEAIKFALAQALATSKFTGLSDTQSRVLNWAGGQNGGANLDQITQGLDFAKLVDRLGLGEVGTHLADAFEKVRAEIAEAVKYGFSDSDIQKIRDQLTEAFASVREGLTSELASLSGLSTEAGDAVGAWAARVGELLSGIREYNQAATEQAAKDRERVIALRQEIAAQQAAEAAARAAAGRLAEAAGVGTTGPRSPGEGGGQTPDQEAWHDFIAEANRAGSRVAELTAELAAMGDIAEQSAIDINQATSDLIQGSASLFEDGLRQFLDYGKSQLQLASEEASKAFAGLGGEDGAIASLYKENVKLAESLTDSAAQAAALQEAEQIRTDQLAELAEAERKWSQQQKAMAQEATAGLFEGLAGLLADGETKTELMRQAEEIRYDLAVAQLRMDYESLKVANEKYKAEHAGLALVSDATLTWINDVLNSLPEDKPPGTGDGGTGGGGGKGGGGGRKDARKRLEDELNDAMRGPLGEWEKRVQEWKDKTAQWVAEARKLGISLDDIKKASEAVRKQMADDARAQLAQMTNPSSSTGKQIIDLKKWRADMEKVAKELGIPLADIRKAYRAEMGRIVQAVRDGVRDFANVLGEDSLGIALRDNHRQAEELRKALEELAKEGVNVTDDLAEVNAAEQERARILRMQSKIGFLEDITKYVDDQKAAIELTKLKGALEIMNLRAQLDALEAAGQLAPEVQAQWEAWFDEAAKKIREGYKPKNEDHPDQTDPRTSIAEIKAQIDDMFDRSGGLAAGFRDLRNRSAELAKQLKAAGIPSDQLAAELARLAEQEEKARQQMGALAVADLFEKVASYMADGAEKEAFLKTAAEIRWQIELANMRMQLEFLHTQGFLVDDNYNKLKKAIESLPDLPNYTPPGGSSGGGSSNQFDDAQGLIDSLRAMLRQDLPDVAQRFADLDAEFARIREQAAELNLDRLLGPGGGEQLISEAYAARVRALWEEILGPLSDFVDSLDLSELSPLTDAQQIALARAQAEATAAAAIGGDAEAAAAWLQQAQAYLQAASAEGTATPFYAQAYAWVRQISEQILAMYGLNTGGVNGAPAPGSGPGAGSTLANLIAQASSGPAGAGGTVLQFPPVFDEARASGTVTADRSIRVLESGFAILHSDNLRQEALLEHSLQQQERIAGSLDRLLERRSNDNNPAPWARTGVVRR